MEFRRAGGNARASSREDSLLSAMLARSLTIRLITIEDFLER